ncbi:hypothetical protein FRX31_019540 [Thalictrum thalictroides]|uniref:Uncharacterized protein n=1 Tax=Thalictrum thalictroides TaxID=46969 RepID=A0A7J6W0H9_THATH|nr:hypothetical protein FRX31_019540 [Thalictrum thalictroides]
MLSDEEIIGGDDGEVHVNENILAKNKFDEKPDEVDKGEVESAAGGRQFCMGDSLACSNAIEDTGYMQVS